MTTHFHLMTTPASASAVPRMMQSIGASYVPFHNKRHERTGTLWEGRYRSSMIQDERYWVTCLRYIELNPVRAGIASRPELYPWSSYRAHALGREDPILSPHPLYLAMGLTDVGRHEAWRAICGSPMPESEVAEIRRAIQAGLPVGEALHDQADSLLNV